MIRWIITLGLLASSAAHAHDLRPGAVALREVTPDVFRLRLTAPLDGARVQRFVPPTLPDGCQFADAETVRCAAGLRGALVMPDLARRRVKVVVHVRWLDGRRFEAVLREGETTVRLPTLARAGSHGLGAVWLGVDHILTGWDHLAFVLALALIAGSLRRVAIAITGFTVAHSLTLAATALGWVRPPGPAAELIIAASVLLLAAEAARQRDTLTRRHPVVVSLVFGLVHGVGFAGALTSLAIPRDALLSTLLAFNLGVELGQLAVLGAALVLAALARRLLRGGLLHARRIAAYAIGVPAGVWTVQRAVEWWG